MALRLLYAVQRPKGARFLISAPYVENTAARMRISLVFKRTKVPPFGYRPVLFPDSRRGAQRESLLGAALPYAKGV